MSAYTSSSSSSSPVSVPTSVAPARCPAVEISGIHPAAALFPLMEGPELEYLVADIRANGLREEIVLYEGLILDGRNRLRACELAGVPPRFVAWDGRGSPLAFVLSRNLHRRHLDESQRAIIAALAKDMLKEEAAQRQHAHQFGQAAGNPPGRGRNRQKSRVLPVSASLQTPRGTDARVAEMLNVSARSVATASRVLAAGDEQVIAAIEAGQLSVSDAASVIDLPKPRQRELLDMVRSGQARTLREAAGRRKPKKLPPAVRASRRSEPHVMRGKVRRACRYFTADLKTLRHYIDLAASGCGGDNDFTLSARDALATAERAMENCLQRHGQKNPRAEGDASDDDKSPDSPQRGAE